MCFQWSVILEKRYSQQVLPPLFCCGQWVQLLESLRNQGHIRFDRIWIQIYNESGFGFTGKSNGLDSWTWPSVTSLFFVLRSWCWCDVILLLSISGFASESASKLDSRIRIRIRALNWQFHWIQPGFGFGKSNMPQNGFRFQFQWNRSIHLQNLNRFRVSSILVSPLSLVKSLKSERIIIKITTWKFARKLKMMTEIIFCLQWLFVWMWHVQWKTPETWMKDIFRPLKNGQESTRKGSKKLRSWRKDSKVS